MLRWWGRSCSLGRTVHFAEAPALVWGLRLLSMVLGGEGVLGSPLAFLGLILGGVAAAGWGGGTSCLDSLELPVLGIWWLFLGVPGPRQPHQAGPTSWELFVPTAGNWRGFLHGSGPSAVTLCEQAVQE